jgi:hypothetical protein
MCDWVPQQGSLAIITAMPRAKPTATDTSEPLVITGNEFRKMLGWGTNRFYAAATAGRFRHLVAVNASSPKRIVYVWSAVEAWISQTPPFSLRPSRYFQHHLKKDRT